MKGIVERLNQNDFQCWIACFVLLELEVHKTINHKGFEMRSLPGILKMEPPRKSHSFVTLYLVKRVSRVSTQEENLWRSKLTPSQREVLPQDAVLNCDDS